MEQNGGNIKLCPDGKYRWYYEFPMLKNPVILFTIWKVMLIASLLPCFVVLLSELSDGFISAAKHFIVIYIMVIFAAFILSCIGYFILAVIYGFKYIVLFEMDENGITHTQKGSRFKKTQAVSWLTVLAGAATNNPEAFGAGVLSDTKYRMTSDFKNVSTVRGIKKNNTVKVNQLFAKNQIYVASEDYDFVFDYISSHCEKAEIK